MFLILDEGTGLQWFPEGSAGVVYGAHDDLASLLADTPGVAGPGFDATSWYAELRGLLGIA